MFNKVSDRYNKSIKNNRGGVIPLLGVSLIIFALTVAVYFVADYVSADYARTGSVYNWDYGYTERLNKVPDAELRVFNKQNPFITEKEVRRSNIYLVKTFAPSDKKRGLVIKTDHSPIMIKVNGRIVYDNQYKTADYVANSYNAVELAGTSREQVVEVFMKLPFSVRFESFVSKGSVSAFSFSLRFFAGAVVFLAGLAAVVLSAILSARKKKLLYSVVVGGLITYIGFAVMLSQLPEITYLFNAPMLYNVGCALVHLTFIFGLLCVVGRMKRRKNLVVAVVSAGIVSAAAYMLALSAPHFGLFAFVATAVTVASAAYISLTAAGYVPMRTQYSTPMFVISVYEALFVALSGFFMIGRSVSMYTYTVSVPSLVVAGTIGYIFYSDYRYREKNSELQKETLRYGDSIDNVSAFIHNMLLCTNEDAFYKTAVGEINNLLLKYNSSYSDVRCGTAVKTGGEWSEIINNGLENCRYELIKNASLENGKGCLFSDTYFDFALKKGGVINVIMHFENITNGLDMLFVSMIESAYCGLEIAYEKICDSVDSREINIILGELALNTEMDNGYSPEHLENIGRYAYALCKKLGMSEDEAQRISLASKLHDIGKIAIPKNIINKSGKLTEEEQVIVGSHVKFGHLILSAYDDDPLLADAAEIARYHHERYDGTGSYGLKGEEIPLAARITTICDVYDALVSERSYKQAWSKERALSYIEDNSGVIFDPELIEPFKQCLDEDE